MNTVEKRKIVEKLENSKTLDWYHRFEVFKGSGIFTPGRLDANGYEWRRKFIGLTEEFVSGKRILDIGAYSGAFSFLMQDLGAEVVAIDVYDPEYNGFNLVKDLRNRDIQHERISVYDLDPNKIGEFDIVAFYGVHYHLRHPLLAFERCNSGCKNGGLLIGGGTGMDGWFHDVDDSCAVGVSLEKIAKEVVGNNEILSANCVNDLPLCGFVPGQFLKDKTNWFIPNLECIVGWVEASGFEVTKKQKTTMPIKRDWNKEKKVNRTTLNYMAIKRSEPLPEYTWKRMSQFEIPRQHQVDDLISENQRLKELLSNNDIDYL